MPLGEVALRRLERARHRGPHASASPSGSPARRSPCPPGRRRPGCRACRCASRRCPSRPPSRPGARRAARRRPGARPALRAPSGPRASARARAGRTTGSTNDCVATAPTPASAQGTTEPTENQWLCTATPSSPVAGSRATIEYVATGRTGAVAAGIAAISRASTPLMTTSGSSACYRVRRKRALCGLERDAARGNRPVNSTDFRSRSRLAAPAGSSGECFGWRHAHLATLRDPGHVARRVGAAIASAHCRR